MEKRASGPIIVLKVDTSCCDRCPWILRNAILLKIIGVNQAIVDPQRKFVTVRGYVEPRMLIAEIAAKMKVDAVLVSYHHQPPHESWRRLTEELPPYGMQRPPPLPMFPFRPFRCRRPMPPIFDHDHHRSFPNGRARSVKNEAMDIIRQYRVLPRLVVFDLDMTLWPLYCHLRSSREMPWLYPHARGILHSLREKGIEVAIASRSPTPEIAITFLDKLGIRSMFVTKEIFYTPTHKKLHFQRVKQRTGVPYSAMLLFDDNVNHIETASRMGMTGVVVSHGVSLAALREGLSMFSRKLN